MPLMPFITCTRTIALTCIAILLLSGCSSRESSEEMSEAQHYRDARKSLDRNAFLAAIDALEELDARFPYGDFAEQTQLDLIYARHRSLDYPGAIAQADRFIRSYPAHPAQDYALYIKGLANYSLNIGLFDQLISANKANRDLEPMKQAFADFEQLVRRHPDSQYAADSRSRMLHIRNLLANHELQAARYYARRQAFIASANRAQHIIRHFQGTVAVEEALAILASAYQSLDQQVLADKSALLLTTNWPESTYLSQDGGVDIAWWPSKRNRWLSLLTFDLL